jgi:hypothetical protein
MMYNKCVEKKYTIEQKRNGLLRYVRVTASEDQVLRAACRACSLLSFEQEDRGKPARVFDVCSRFAVLFCYGLISIQIPTNFLNVVLIIPKSLLYRSRLKDQPQAKAEAISLPAYCTNTGKSRRPM